MDMREGVDNRTVVKRAAWKIINRNSNPKKIGSNTYEAFGELMTNEL